MTPTPQAVMEASNAGLALLLHEMQVLAQVIPTLAAPQAHLETQAEHAAREAACEEQFDNMPV